MSDEQTPHLPGVRYMPPPPNLIGPISAAVDAYAGTLKPGQRGGIVGRFLDSVDDAHRADHDLARAEGGVQPDVDAPVEPRDQ